MNKKRILLVLCILVFTIFTIIFIGRKWSNEDIKVTNFNKIVPREDIYFSSYDFDFQEAFDKGISSSKKAVSSEYLDLQDKYNEALSLYLMKKIPSILNLDKELDSLYIKSVPQLTPKEVAEDTDTVRLAESYYHSLSYLDSNYIYLVNNTYVERLSQEDIDLLKSSDLSDEMTDSELMKMIERTYEKVLSSRNGPVAFRALENGSTDTVFVSGEALIFWLTYEDCYNSDGALVHGDKTTQAYQKVVSLSEKYKKVFSDELGHEVEIFIK